MTVNDMSVRSTDCIHELRGKIYVPDKPVKGLFQIAHGMQEYIGRYDGLMRTICDAGYVCFGFDMLGHGKTALNDGELGYIADKGGWSILIDDTYAFAKAVKELYPHKKYVLMGHSMGSFVARLTAERYQQHIDALIICGTGGRNPAASIAVPLTDIIGFFGGKHRFSKFVDDLAFGSFNKRAEADGDKGWLTRDPEIRKKYLQDKFCTFNFSVGAMGDLIRLNKRSNANAWYKNLRKDMPIFLIAGSEDPVGDYGKGVTQVYDTLNKYGFTDASLKLYQGSRHEIHNDLERDTVARDIISWSDKHVSEIK